MSWRNSKNDTYATSCPSEGMEDTVMRNQQRARAGVRDGNDISDYSDSGSGARWHRWGS